MGINSCCLQAFPATHAHTWAQSPIFPASQWRERAVHGLWLKQDLKYPPSRVFQKLMKCRGAGSKGRIYTRRAEVGTLWCPKEEAPLCLCPWHLFPELLRVRAGKSHLLCTRFGSEGRGIAFSRHLHGGIPSKDLTSGILRAPRR